MFLHSQGYSFFNTPKLTYVEIMALVDAKNRQIKQENERNKKATKKSSGRYRR